MAILSLRSLTLLALGVGAAFSLPGASNPPPGSEVNFGREILPILTHNCFACHGPDDKERKSGLRLDIREEALKPAKSGDHAIIPGDIAQSALVARITAEDPDDLMPPPKTGKKLSPQQIDLLKRWIAGGARWETHWAFKPITPPELPAVKKTSWPRNEIDRFTLARMEEAGLEPSPEADKVTLARRTTFDLSGLPPTPEEVDAYLADQSPQAYDKLVTRLMDSSRYGEHMARYWMDAVRYADSHGYHIDSERSIWKYREWVIQAFNNNMPYNQFTTEQLAGDLLPNPTVDQKIASGFIRCNMSTGEGGAIVEEYLAKYTFDRVETAGTVWMGLTLLCCRCHTHKYDPIAHKEYYGLYAFFHNLDESVMDGNRPNPDPFMQVPAPEQTKRLGELKGVIEDGQKKLDAPMPALDESQGAWEKKWRETLGQGWTVLAPSEFKAEGGAQFKALDDKSVLVEGPNPQKDVHEMTLRLPAGRLAALRLEAMPDESLPQKSSARADDGSFRLSEFEVEKIKRNAEGKEEKPEKVKWARAVSDVAREGHEADKALDGKADTGWQPAPTALKEPHAILFVLGEPISFDAELELRVRLRYEASVNKRAMGRFRIAAAREESLAEALVPPKSSPWQVVGPFKSAGLQAGFSEVLEPETNVDLAKSYEGVREKIKWTKTDIADGKAHLLVNELHGVHGVYYLYRTINALAPRQVELSVRADDVFKLWVNGEPLLERAAPAKAEEGPARLQLRLKAGENKILAKVVNHQGACYFTFDQTLDDKDSVPPDLAALFATVTDLSADQKKKVQVYYRQVNSPEFKTRYGEVAQWREEQSGLERAIPTTMVAKDRGEMRPTKLLMRGEYDKPGDVVGHGVPAVLGPFPKDAPTNRLGLAQWLLSPSHPLTARVTVNRFWQQVFGVGLVKTAEDFGIQGERPSHPELLDWLAEDLIHSGWDVKRLMRLIVSSATYRQTSQTTPERHARDPENRLLARGPRFRVDAEGVRDTTLYVSGLLVEKFGGRSVKPYEPPGLWEAVSFNNSQKYVPETGDGQYRRSLYTHWKRQSPPPGMLIFDAPTREFCVVRRSRTNTPLQALALLNDPQYVESSKAFARRMLKDGGSTTEDRLAYGFRLATSRVPDKTEIRVLKEVLQAQLAQFQSQPESARKYLDSGGSKVDSGTETSELAAWATIASMLLNLDETLTKS